MKKIAIAMALVCFSVTAFGQKNESSYPMPKVESSKSGFFVGIDYMNLTDVKAKSSYSIDDGQISESYNDSSTIHVGVAGFRAGYSSIGASGYGFNAGLRMLETFNRSEYEGMKVEMLIPEINFQMALGQYIIPYIGLNTSLWTGSSGMNDWRSGIGAQAGIGVRINRALAVNAGYTLMTQTRKSKEPGFSSEAEIQFGGFSSNVIYMF